MSDDAIAAQLLSLEAEIVKELARATEKFGPFQSYHEGYAVIREELEEMWERIKERDPARLRIEAVQTAAMALRFLVDFERMVMR